MSKILRDSLHCWSRERERSKPTVRCLPAVKDEANIPQNPHNRLEAYSGLANWVDCGREREDYCRKLVAKNF